MKRIYGNGRSDSVGFDTTDGIMKISVFVGFAKHGRQTGMAYLQYLMDDYIFPHDEG